MLLVAGFSCRRVVSVLLTSCRSSVRGYCETPDRNKPVKFTTSEAAGWRAEYSRSGNIGDDTPDAQPFIVSFSTGIFLWYFLWYREESDVDRKFDFSEQFLYNRVPDLEEVQLQLVRTKKLEKGEDVQAIEVRLKELKKIRQEGG